MIRAGPPLKNALKPSSRSVDEKAFSMIIQRTLRFESKWAEHQSVTGDAIRQKEMHDSIWHQQTIIRIGQMSLTDLNKRITHALVMRQARLRLRLQSCLHDIYHTETGKETTPRVSRDCL